MITFNYTILRIMMWENKTSPLFTHGPNMLSKTTHKLVTYTPKNLFTTFYPQCKLFKKFMMKINLLKSYAPSFVFKIAFLMAKNL